MNIKKLLDNLLLLFLFLVPLSTVYIFDEQFLGGDKWQFGTGLIYATELLLWLIFIIFIINQLKAKTSLSIANIKAKISRPDYRLLITLSGWLLIIYAGLTIIWSANQRAGLYLWYHYLEVGCLFFILLISKLDAKKIAGVLTLSGAIQALLAIQQFLTQKVASQKWLGLVTRTADQPGGLVIEADGGRWLRASGTFNDPNLLSGFLVISLLSGCFFYAQTSYKKTTLALMSIATAGLFFTFSRGSLLVLLAGIFIWLITQKPNWQKVLMPVVTIVLTLTALAFIFSPLVFSRANPTGRLEQRSIQERLTQNQTATELFKQQPLFGVGLNNYTYTLYQKQPGLPAHKYQEVENIFLLVLTELGLIGLVLFLILIITSLGLALKLKNHLGLTLLFATLALGFFYHYPLTQFPGLTIFWLALALAIYRPKK